MLIKQIPPRCSQQNLQPLFAFLGLFFPSSEADENGHCANPAQRQQQLLLNGLLQQDGAEVCNCMQEVRIAQSCSQP